MNIKLSYNWIKEFVPTKLTAREFASRVSLSGPAIERLKERGDEWEKIVLGRVIKIKPHPNADKLKIALTVVGTEVAQIVCGGINVREGMKVAVALPGAQVRWHGEGAPVALTTTEIRGEKSHGMICAANEIGLFEYFPHAEREIMDLTDVSGEPGTPLAGALGLQDTIFDIEVTSNRVDAFSVQGFAREAGAILGLRVGTGRSAGVYPPPGERPIKGRATTASPAKAGGYHGLQVSIQSKLCGRYMGALVRGVTVGPSPWWMRKRLIDSGIRPINNLADITNYVMLEQGRPMHVFDSQKLEVRGQRSDIAVRHARAGEVLKALDGKDYQLDQSMLVIADTERPIAIAGVMGGEESGVTEKTKDIIFECALFDPVTVRKTARALNLHSESSQRFEKGLALESVPLGISRALELTTELAGGSLVSMADRATAKPKKISVPFSASRVSAAIGVPISGARQKSLLKSLGFKVTGAGDRFRAQVPWWRSRDIEGEHDIVEEVARLFGYHNLPAEMPSGMIPNRERDPEIGLEDEIKEFFRGAGWAEAMTYSFVSERVARYDGGEAHLRLTNPLTDEWTHMRQGLTPSLLQSVEKNQGEFPAGMMFETARVYHPQIGELPHEILHLSGIVWSKETDLPDRQAGGTQFFAAKGVLEALFDHLGVHAHLVPSPQSPGPNYHPGRVLVITVNDKTIGMVGELHPKIAADFGLKHRAAVLELQVAPLVHAARLRSFASIPAFPPVKRDISVVVDELVTYDSIMHALTALDPLLAHVELFDVYAGKGIPAGKRSLSFHLSYQSPDRTLAGDEADRVHEKVMRVMREKFGAEIRE